MKKYLMLSAYLIVISFGLFKYKQAMDVYPNKVKLLNSIFTFGDGNIVCHKLTKEKLIIVYHWRGLRDGGYYVVKTSAKDKLTLDILEVESCKN